MEVASGSRVVSLETHANGCGVIVEGASKEGAGSTAVHSGERGAAVVAEKVEVFHEVPGAYPDGVQVLRTGFPQAVPT